MAKALVKPQHNNQTEDLIQDVLASMGTLMCVILYVDILTHLYKLSLNAHTLATSSGSLYLLPLDPNNIHGHNFLVPLNMYSCTLH